MKKTAELVDCYRLMHKYVETVQHTVLKRSELTHAQMNVLTEIAHSRHINLHELSAQLNHEKSSVSRTVESLRLSGYLNAVKTKRDRRTLDLTLTEKGESFIEMFRKKSEQYYRRILNSLPESEHASILASISVLKTAVSYNIEQIQKDVLPDHLYEN